MVAKNHIAFFSPSLPASLFGLALAALHPQSAQAQLPAFREDWNASASARFDFVSHGGSQAVSNIPAAGAEDGKALQLSIGKGAAVSPAGGSEVESKSLFQYGTLTARIRTADCKEQPNAGIVTGFFTYFNDGSDQNGNGLPDNSELDFEWLCGEPQVLYLTFWTDYRDADAVSKRVTRTVNLATGKILDTEYREGWGAGTKLTGAENDPTTVATVAGYNSSTAFYEYGLSWDAERVLGWMINPKDSSRLVLWDYRGPRARIPARASRFLINAWHTNTWTPPDNPAANQAPANTISALVDWAAYDPKPVTTALAVGSGSARSASSAKSGNTLGAYWRLPSRDARIDARGRHQSLRAPSSP